jgi:hypothetical protein
VGTGVGDGAGVGVGGGGEVGIAVGKAMGVKATVGLAAVVGVGATSDSNEQADKTTSIKLHQPSLRNDIMLASPKGKIELYERANFTHIMGSWQFNITEDFHKAKTCQVFALNLPNQARRAANV